MGRAQMLTRLILLGAIFSAAPLDRSSAWGDRGHSVIAEIAQRRLTPRAASEIRMLLGSGASLASIASWPDGIELVRPETINWHFVNIPYDAEAYDPERDCRESKRGDCVVKAIERFEAKLADPTAPSAKRAEAVTFLVHLIGDVHQPMHCIDRGDAGGSRLMISLFEKPMSLHAVWDYGIIDKHGFDWGQLVRDLEESGLEKLEAQAAVGEPRDWAKESHDAAVEYAYPLPWDLKLDEIYYRRALPVVMRRLALAGLRLARVLNESLDPSELPKVDQRPNGGG